MNHLTADNKLIETEYSGCPFHQHNETIHSLKPEDELSFPQHKKVFSQYLTNTLDKPELILFYGDKEISFDEPELFNFGETLAKQSKFYAGSAVHWGETYKWNQVKVLLEQLLAENILIYANDDTSFTYSKDSVCQSPLSPSLTTRPRDWFECETITKELTGRPLELSYLEMVVPVFRVAHMTVDTENRQVGEANVFPKTLRLDVPTSWRTCLHAGSRFMDEKPMNVTALKSIRQHWQASMVVLSQIRRAFIKRFPHVQNGWTVGDLERLSSLVLAVPAYFLMCDINRIPNGELDPVLSTIFRVTDGVRMTMHDMLFIHALEPTTPPDAPMTSSALYDYAERNFVFHSDYGVCAGPKAMIDEFLSVLVDGNIPKYPDDIQLSLQAQLALADLEKAFDYGLLGLQVHAIIFSLWPAMTRTYEQIWQVLQYWPKESAQLPQKFISRFQESIDELRSTELAYEALRLSRETVYGDMYMKSAQGMESSTRQPTLAELLSPDKQNPLLAEKSVLRSALLQNVEGDPNTVSIELDILVDIIMDYLLKEQAIVKAASAVQAKLNAVLGRPQAKRLFTAADIDIYYLLQPGQSRLAYLVDQISDLIGLEIVVNKDAIYISKSAELSEQADKPVSESCQHGAGKSTCDGHGTHGRLP